MFSTTNPGVSTKYIGTLYDLTFVLILRSYDPTFELITSYLLFSSISETSFVIVISFVFQTVTSIIFSVVSFGSNLIVSGEIVSLTNVLPSSIVAKSAFFKTLIVFSKVADPVAISTVIVTEPGLFKNTNELFSSSNTQIVVSDVLIV